MAGIEGLALDPYGEQLNQAGASLGKGIDTMVQRQKAEDEANAPVDPMTQAALKMEMLQRLHPDWTPEELGKALQLYEAGHMQHPELTPTHKQPQGPRIQQTSPAYGPGGPPQQAPAPAPQGLGAMAATPTPGPQPGMEQAAAPAAQLPGYMNPAGPPQTAIPMAPPQASIAPPQAPAPAPVTVPQAPVINPPTQGNIVASTAGMMNSLGGKADPRAAIPSETRAIGPVSGGLGSFADRLSSMQTEKTVKADRPPIVLSQSDKDVLGYQVKNKDYSKVHQVLSTSRAGKVADDAVKLQMKDMEFKRAAMQEEAKTRRMMTALDAKSVVTSFMTDANLDKAHAQEASAVFLELLKQHGARTLLAERIAAATKSNNTKLRIELMKAGDRMKVERDRIIAQAGAALDASPTAKDTLDATVAGMEADVAVAQGYANTIGTDIGETAKFAGPQEYGTPPPPRKEVKPKKGVAGALGYTDEKTVQDPPPKLPLKPAKPVTGPANKSPSQTGMVTVTHVKTGKSKQYSSDDPNVAKARARPDDWKVE